MIEQDEPILAQDDEIDSDAILTGDEEEDDDDDDEDDDDDDEDSDVPDPPEGAGDL